MISSQDESHESTTSSNAIYHARIKDNARKSTSLMIGVSPSLTTSGQRHVAES